MTPYIYNIIIIRDSVAEPLVGYASALSCNGVF